MTNSSYAQLAVFTVTQRHCTASCSYIRSLSNFWGLLGALKMLDVKLHDVKQMDEISGHGIAGHGNAGHENVLALYYMTEA